MNVKKLAMQDSNKFREVECTYFTSDNSESFQSIS